MSLKHEFEPLERWPAYRGRPLLVCGPCSAESRDQVYLTAKALVENRKVHIFRAGIWKARTRPGGFAGVGLDGLGWLAEVERELGVPVATEVANARHVQSVIEHGLKSLWIGARTTASPFAVQEIADALRGADVTVFIKNPVSPDVDLWQGAIERVREAGIERIAAVHRGFQKYGEDRFRNAPHWQIPIELLLRLPGLPIICDPSHICGEASLLREVCQNAMDLAYDGLMIESHIDPSEALSDARQQVEPSKLRDLLDGLVLRATGSSEPSFQRIIETLRTRMDDLDGRLLEVLQQRMVVARRIAQSKREQNVTVLQASRFEETVKRCVSRGRECGLSPGFVRAIFQAIHQESIDQQREIMNEKWILDDAALAAAPPKR